MRPPDLIINRFGRVPRRSGSVAVVRRFRALPALRDLLARVAERRPEPLGAERLQQEIEGMHFERSERVLVVRRHEHHRRIPGRLNRARQIQSVHFRHLDVQKEQLGARGFNRRHRLLAIRAFADDLEVVFLLEQGDDARAGNRLVVDDERPDFRHAAPTLIDSLSERSTAKGMLTVTRKPGSALENTRL